MKTIGNIIWLFTVGLLGAVIYLAAGLLFCVTIIGIPIGRQCFKFASLSLWPFGREVVPGESTLCTDNSWKRSSGSCAPFWHALT